MSRMVKLLLALLFIAIPLASRADTFDFTATGNGNGFSGTGQFVTNGLANGSYQITSISGTGSGSSRITGLIAPGGYGGNDNLLFQNGGPLFDLNGFSFTDIMGDTTFMVNIFYSGGYFAQLTDSDQYYTSFPVNVNVTPSAVTPEPSSLLLLGTGLIALAYIATRRRGMKFGFSA